MDKLTLDNITKDHLKNSINNLRDVLNEICCTDSGTEEKKERLDISMKLDKLIVEYMNKIS
jgi:hypothetical protein